MKKIINNTAAFVAALLMASCGDGLTGETFTIEGHITGAADSTLRLENTSLRGVHEIATVTLDSTGTFLFKAERTEAPEFYRLRIANKLINLSVDSTETINITAQWATMNTDYKVEGSDNCVRIKDMTLKQLELQRQVMEIDRIGMMPNVKQEKILALIEDYKANVARKYIFTDPSQTSSYFALFQTVGGLLIFDNYSNIEDIKALRAVATCWDSFYPNAERSKNIMSIALAGIERQREEMAQQQAAQQIVNDSTKISYSGVIDLNLVDAKGKRHKLSDMKGKVVLLDFHAFSMKESPARILSLRELYNKYSQRGFEIYQVSLDDNRHFWTQQVESLPWISVRDEDGSLPQKLAVYNVQAIPDFFLIDRDNNLVKRQAQIENLEQEIENLL